MILQGAVVAGAECGGERGPRRSKRGGAVHLVSLLLQHLQIHFQRLNVLDDLQHHRRLVSLQAPRKICQSQHDVRTGPAMPIPLTQKSMLKKTQGVAFAAQQNLQ